MPAACYVNLKKLYTGLMTGAQMAQSGNDGYKQEELFDQYAAQPGQTREGSDGVKIGIPSIPPTQRNAHIKLNGNGVRSINDDAGHPIPGSSRDAQIGGYSNKHLLTDQFRSPGTLMGQGTVLDFMGVADGGGYKASMDDPRKLPITLIPTAAVEGLARVLQYGAKKYAPNNWRRGMKWSEVYSALQRHLLAWNDGETHDPESGLNHLDHAMFGVSVLEEYAAHSELYGAFDDRFARPVVNK